MSARAIAAVAVLALLGSACGASPVATKGPSLPPAAASAGAAPSIVSPTPRPSPTRAATPEAPFRAEGPTVGDPAPFPFARSEVWTLPSGVRVVLLEDPDAFTVSARAVVRTSSTPGMLSLAMRSIGCGTKSWPTSKDLTRELQDAEVARMTQWAMTDVELVVTMPHYAAARGLRDLTEMITSPTFEADCVGRVLRSARDESSAAPTPSAIAGAVSWALRHESGRADSLVVTDAVLDAASRDAIAASYAGAVRPAQTTVVIAGNTTRAEVTLALGPLAAPWAAPERGARARSSPLRAAAPAAIPRSPGNVVVVDRPGETSAHLSVGFDMPRARAADRRAMDVAAEIVARAVYRAMEAHFRGRPGVPWSTALTTYDNGEDNRVSWKVDVPAPDLEPTLKMFAEEARALASGGPPDDALRTVKRARLAKLAVALDTPADLALAVATALRIGQPIAELEEEPRHWVDVKAADVQRAATRLVLADAMITVVAPRSAVEPGLARALGRPIEARDPSGKRAAPIR
jgi:predicted Zn-dependent peptidase